VGEAPAERRTMRRNIKELPPTAWLLIGGSVINRFGSFVVPFLVLYLRKQGFSIERSGLAVAAYGGGELIAGPLGGVLADRLGRRAIIASSMFASAAAMVALSQAHAYSLIVVLAFAAGLVSEARRPASLALLTDLVPAGQRVTAFAVLRMGENVAFAGGMALGGLIANTSFLWLFVGDAASSIVYGTIALVALPEGVRVSRAEEARRGGGYGGVTGDPAFLLFLAATVLLAFIYFQPQATLPLHVRQAGLSNTDFGLLLSLNGLLVVLFELPLSSFTMRRPPRQMLAIGFLLIGLGFGLTGMAHSLATLALTVAIWTLGEMVSAPVAYAYVADIAPEHMRGRYQGLFFFSFSSGAILGPALGTFLFAHGEMAFWAICGGLGLVAALLTVAGGLAGGVPTRLSAESAPEQAAERSEGARRPGPFPI
jgi:MFS family permease